MKFMFLNCSSLSSLDLSNFNTVSVTDMNEMFSGCSSLTSLDLSSFNTSNVTDMGIMFQDCSSLTAINLSSFNTSNVTNMNRLFSGIKVKVLDISNFDTRKVTTFEKIFNNSTSLETIYVGANWDISANTADSSQAFPSSCHLRNFSSSNTNYRDLSYANTGANGYLTLKTN